MNKSRTESTRRQFLYTTGSSVVASSICSNSISARAQSLITTEAQNSIDRGLDYLAKLQNDNGSFGRSNFARNVGVCGLAGIAWTAHGSTPLRGRFGKHTQRCVEYLLTNSRADGFIVTDGAADRRPMYGHGFATMFLCEAYGMSQSPTLRTKLVAAIKIILASQNEEGGWRYEPQRADADISVTACQMTALRAAKNAGFYVPNEIIERATKYIVSCQNPDGGFAYQTGKGESQFARSAAAVVAMYGAGIYDGPVIENGLSFIMNPDAEHDDQYFYYGIFYAAQAIWQSGLDNWHAWFPKIRNELVNLQKPDGSWTDPVGSAYATSIALIALQMENNYVPLFQK